VAREVWEEAGVRVWNVKYHSGQPWVRFLMETPCQTLTIYPIKPYPANLMLGFYARADSTKPIRTDLDKELVGKCQFYPRPQIQEALTLHDLETPAGSPAEKSNRFFGTRKGLYFAKRIIIR